MIVLDQCIFPCACVVCLLGFIAPNGPSSHTMYIYYMYNVYISLFLSMYIVYTVQIPETRLVWGCKILLSTIVPFALSLKILCFIESIFSYFCRICRNRSRRTKHLRISETALRFKCIIVNI